MKIIVLILLLQISLPSYASLCENTLNLSAPIDATDRLISYLTVLVRDRVIGSDEIDSFATQLAQGILSVPISQTRLTTDSDAVIHHGELQKQLQANLDKRKLLEWARHYLKGHRDVQKGRQVSKRDTQSPYLRPEFLQVTVGTKEPHTFEMMTTPVTQKQWVDIMGENPSHFFDGTDSIKVVINGITIRLRPDYPVEGMTWYSALEFANRMSQRSGLTPAYNLQPVTFDPRTSSEDGSWKATNGEVRIGSSSGDILHTEGFRLPTEMELVSIIPLLRQQNKNAFDGSFTDLHRYVWFAENTSRGTRPVAALAPLMLEGQPFYDLAGNVWEWSHSNFQENAFAPGCSTYRVNGKFIFGGSFNSLAGEVLKLILGSQNPNHFSQSTGFRLVRTLKK